MELNFDKEMDALLRQAARSGEVVSTNPQSHLDADEISAFAENALPEKTRNLYIKHFADCDRCRTILSNTILLNSEAEIETASSVVSADAPEIVETKLPWYRKLFLMPKLAYTMGALVLIFGGMLGFLVLQNINQSGDLNIASANKSAERGPNAAEDQIFSEPSESNTALSNAANTTANTSIAATNSTTATNANTSFSTANSASNPVLTEQTKTGMEDESRDSKNETGRKENDFLKDGASGAGNRALAKSAEEKSEDKQRVARQDAVTDSVVAAPPPKPSAQATPPSPAKDDADDAESAKLSTRAKKSAKREETSKQIGGKTFNRVGGVWIDSAYNKYDGVSSNATLPPTQTIRRGSNEYRKLDRQVRIIAESLEGPVIIVWKAGAYRIQ